MQRSSTYILPMPNKVIFPYQSIKIRLTETFEFNQKMHNNFVGLVTNLSDSDLSAENASKIKKKEKFSEYGVLAKITKQDSASISYNSFDRQYREIRTFNAIAIARFRIQRYTRHTPAYLADIEIFKEDLSPDVESKIRESPNFLELKKLAASYSSEILSVRREDDKDGAKWLESELNITKITYTIASWLDLTIEERLLFLQIDDIATRITELIKLLRKSLGEAKINKELDEKVRREVKKESENMILRRKLNEINKRLYGEEEDEFSEFEKKIKEANLPENVLKVVEREVKRLKSGGMGQEANVVRNYVETILELPWSKTTKDLNDLKKAEEILDRDHFGLEKVKKRILEFLAVRSLKGNSKGSIICLHGPPGVGKTSLGKSIAESLNRNFARISLGGVHDEAELRGHRRTYVAALPGIIIQTLKKCGSKNPVILLDEIDKVGGREGAGVRGDVSAALLEILDPKQNNTFMDHYLGMPFDLSEVLFIATANRIDNMQPALLDRLELINIPGYTLEEKLKIAEKYLVARQIDENGLKQGGILIENDSLEVIIKGYTKEAGVRELERTIGAICRSIAVDYSKHLKSDPSKDFPPVHITPALLSTLLGAIIYDEDIQERITQPGVAIGMAWTSVGGKLLYVETSRSPGKGKIEITGQLGEVMKESVYTGLGWIKAHTSRLAIDPKVFENCDINIHFPAAASPKDGPSAGITIVTALVSLFTERMVRSDISMTGEISLKGVVLGVGGIREKVLAAYGGGIKGVILPEKNRKDVEEVSKEIRERMNFYFVKDVESVLEIALEKNVYNPVQEHDGIPFNKLSKL